jgi:hypothetical protein
MRTARLKRGSRELIGITEREPQPPDCRPLRNASSRRPW